MGYHVATEAILSFLLAVFAASAFFSASRNAETEMQAEKYCSYYRAARWLATYNFAKLSALSDVIVKRLGISLREVQGLTNAQLEKFPYYGCVGQMLPLRAVPINLQDAAVAYNSMLLKAGQDDTEFRQPIRAAPEDEVRLLRAALFIMTRAETEVMLEDIHGSTGVPLPHVKAVAVALRSRAEWDMARLLPIEEPDPEPDPESILPSIY